MEQKYIQMSLQPSDAGFLSPWECTTRTVELPLTMQSEGFNTVLKRLQLWREFPLDLIVLSLYHLQAFYYNEIQRGICQMGNYSLQPQFSHLARSPDEVKSLVCIAPEDIVDRVRSVMLHPQSPLLWEGMWLISINKPSVIVL